MGVVYDPFAKVPVADLVTDVLYAVPELPFDAAVYYIREAADELARTGNVIRRKATIWTECNVSNYLLEPTDCGEIVAVLRVRNVAGSLCSEVTRLLQEPGRVPCGSFCWFTPPNEINFTQTGCNFAYEVVFSVAPEPEACEIDKVFQTKYRRLLTQGALSYIFGLSEQPWASVTKAREYRTTFEMGIRNAAIERMTNGMRGMAFAKKRRVL